MQTFTGTQIKTGLSTEQDPRTAARELHAAIRDPDMALGVFYCSPAYDLEALGSELAGLFGEAELIGCTTAGEISPRGYHDSSISGFSLSGQAFQAATARFDQLREFQVGQALEAGKSIRELLRRRAPDYRNDQAFALTLIDGLSTREEPVAAALYNSLGEIPLFGGSAGDGLNFGTTYLYHEGAFRTDCAILALVHSLHPFRVFKTQHFEATETKMVVTAADSPRRIVYELNGEPAAAAYADAIGIPRSELDPIAFATNPVVVKIGGSHYVRSIQKQNPDGSLSFYCAIDEGIVLSLARGGDLIEGLQTLFQDLERDLGPLQLVVGCDCILRNLEIRRNGIRDEVGRILGSRNTVGFSTYGEQYNAMHVNQTFTGVAIGSSRQEA